MAGSDVVLALTDHQDIYAGQMLQVGKKCVAFKKVEGLIQALVDDVECSGILLDVSKVMKSAPENRDRLLALTRNIPIVRTKMDLMNYVPIFLDDLECLQRGNCQNARIEDRVDVRLEAMWSGSSDPVMATPSEGVILDISSGGCFLHVLHSFPDDNFIHLKPLELTNQRPIYCAVRWRRNESSRGLMAGVGLKFIDISDSQLVEINEKLI